MPTTVTQKCKLFLEMSERTARWAVNQENPACPLNEYVGNDDGVARLRRAAFTALQNSKHDCGDFSVAIFGPASVGKTTLAKLFAKTLDLPFVEIGPSSVSTPNDVLKRINEVLENTFVKDGAGVRQSLELVEVGDGGLVIPPCVVFLDEVHGFNKRVIAALLKATEPKDLVLDTGKWVADTKHVCWVIATTDRGLLPAPFDTRFSKVFLSPYGVPEIARIVRRDNPDWDDEVCSEVARYNPYAAREALEFAKDVVREDRMNPGDLMGAVRRIAWERGIDELGMTAQRLGILAALARRGPLSCRTLAGIVGCGEEELVKFVIPPMLYGRNGEESMVEVSSRGYCITEAGAGQLAMRERQAV